MFDYFRRGNHIKVMKKILVIIVSMILFVSCSDKKSLNHIVHSYIDTVEDRIKGEENVMLKVKIDTSVSGYIAYRIETYLYLLGASEIPNEISEYKSYKISYFTSEVVDSNEVKEIQLELAKRNFYNIDRVYINSNLPEWVIIDRVSDGHRVTLKDTHYKSLFELINNVSEGEFPD